MYHRQSNLIAALGFGVVGALATSSAVAQIALSSNPGATYTMYLDMEGFDYTNVANPDRGVGFWTGGDSSPGMVPAYNGDANAKREVWARVANAYRGFNINVTTVDPAIAAGQAGSPAQRIAYYDQQAHMCHTIFGGNGSWLGITPGGISQRGGIGNANVVSGAHTNWSFSVNNFDIPWYVAVAASHENGHMLGLTHQYTALMVGTSYGEEGYAPILGLAYYEQRATWRNGATEDGIFTNEVAFMVQNNDALQVQDDGIGHSTSTATRLPINPDGTVNVNAPTARGFIMPTAASGYSTNSYTSDFFWFYSNGTTPIALTVNNGDDFLQRGVADPGMTMRARLNIYASDGSPAGTGVESGDTLSVTYSGTLPAGSYYAEVVSFGRVITTHEPDNEYFNMGGYFMTGSGLGVPCVADVDGGLGNGLPDGGVTIDDLLYYLSIFEQGDIGADVDDGSFTGTPDGGVTIDDLLYYLFRFEAGC